MATTNIGNWWLLAVKGLLAIVLGALIIAQPVDAVVGIAVFLGVIALLAGVTLIIYAVGNRKRTEDWGWLLAEGILDILIGIAIITYPGLSILLLTTLLGVWFIMSGIFQLIYYSRHRRSGRTSNRQWGLFNGIITLILGIIIIVNPLGGAVGLTIVVGITAIIYGILQIYTAFLLQEKASDLPPMYNENSIQP